MSVPWYVTFFTPPYWALAEHEYTTERTRSEVRYLAGTLAELSPGTRLLDAGAGMGRHAFELAQQGYDVQAVEVSPWTIQQAELRRPAGLQRVRFVEADLLHDRWPVETVDAAIFMQSFGWGTDHDQFRLLQRVRDLLSPDGVLILDHSELTWILANFIGEAEMSLPHISFQFEREFSPADSRMRGTITVSRPARPPQVLRHDIRLYTTAELAALVREAGFEIVRFDSDFVSRSRPTAQSRYVQIVARRRPVASRALAVHAHSTASLAELDLRWSPEEMDWASPRPDRIWSDMLAETGDQGATLMRQYAVDDPYGGIEAAPVLSRLHHCHLDPIQITFGAGVTGLLASLAQLCRRGSLLASSLQHPDLPVWAAQLGAEVHLYEDGEDLEERFAHTRPALVALEHPDLAARRINIDRTERICRVAASTGTIVLVDETRASYLEPLDSHVPVTSRCGNLVVLRSVSKAYVCGGARVGYAVSGHDAAARVREVAPPLQVSRLSYAFALRLLDAGDLFSDLRNRTAAVKPVVEELTRAQGFEVHSGAATLPWLLAEHATLDPCDHLRKQGIAVKRCVGWLRNTHQPRRARISVPLSIERLQCFERFMMQTTAR